MSIFLALFIIKLYYMCMSVCHILTVWVVVVVGVVVVVVSIICVNV